MFFFKPSVLLSLIILLSYTWAASWEPKSGDQDVPKLNYQELFHPSLDVTRSSHTDVVELLCQTIRTSQQQYHYWLLSHFPLLSVLTTKSAELLPSDLSKIVGLPRATRPGLDVAVKVENVVMMNDLATKIYKYLIQQLLEQSDTPVGQYFEVLSAWKEKYSEKLVTFRGLATSLKSHLFGEKLKILLYELAYFLNLLPFETSFEVLHEYKQQGKYSNILVNILGDSLLGGGKHLHQFYEQFETAIGVIGYLPKDLLKLQGIHTKFISGAFRDIIGELISKKHYDSERQEFMKRMWRVACTLHLSATLQSRTLQARPGEKNRWQEKYAPAIYQAIEVGSKEVFNSEYETYDEYDEHIGGHIMLVEVERTSDTLYRVKQFNSGNGISVNHKRWQGSTPGSGRRYLSFVDMPRLSEEQIKSTGYYSVSGQNPEALLAELYKNKHLAQDKLYTNPLFYEQPQLAGTCGASSKMFYFRFFGLEGRLLEIDFKVELIKQLLSRMENVQKHKLSRPFLLESVNAEKHARSAGRHGEGNRILKERQQVFKAVRMEEVDQVIFMFPQMFISIISSALNEILASLYWIINNDRPATATILFDHFLKEVEPIFESTSPYASELLARVLPLIHELHKKHFRGIELPSGIRPKITDDLGKDLK